MAVLGLTCTLGAEVGTSGVRVDALSPGPVRGDLMAAQDTAAQDTAAPDSSAQHRIGPLPAVALGRQPLVLLSGMLGSGALWDEVSPALNDLVLPWPCRIDLDDSVAEMAASVLAEAPPRFALCGHSLGAIVALDIVRREPQRVRRLILIGATARGPTPEQQQAWSDWRERTERGEFTAVADELTRATLAPARRGDAGLVAVNTRMAHAVGAAGFLRQLRAQATRPDSLDSLARIDVPVLVLAGERDGICPPPLQQELAQRCPRAELVTVEGGGHTLPLECPAEVAAALRGALLNGQ